MEWKNSSCFEAGGTKPAVQKKRMAANYFQSPKIEKEIQGKGKEKRENVVVR